MKKLLIGFFGVSFLLMSCSTIQQQMGKVALKLMTKKEKDFSKIAAIGKYDLNLYPTDVGISMLGTEDWEAGQNAVGVQFVKPEGGIGVIALDGTVTIDGVEAGSYGGGVYMALFDGDDRSDKTVRVENADGLATEFTLQAPPQVRIKSINGKAEGAEISLNDPLELELDYEPAAEGKRVQIALITSAVGAKGFAYFQSTLAKGKVTVPADAFKHKHINGGGPTGKDVTNWVKGDNHLQVTLIEQDRSNDAEPFAYFKKVNTVYDTVPVTVTGDTEGRSYIRVNGDSEEASGEFKYTATSSNAWYARPLNTNIKRIGISSLSVSGTLYKQEVETSERDNYATGYREITTTTTTFQFPELDDEYWNQFLESIYSDLTTMLEHDYNASLVNVNQITSNPIYDEFFTPEDENTQEYIAKNLRDTKRLIPNSLGEIMSEATTAMVADGGTLPRLLRDMNMDAFMDVVINYQVAGGEGNTIVLLPNVSYRVVGQTQAFDGTTNTWVQGSIQGPGVPFSESEFSDLNALNRIGQKDVIIKLIKQSIEELTSKQAEFGYDEVWNVALSN
ncbi:MAG: hypothetical protein JJ971_16255 [Balneolaceae bacterium]|nr:hypothetical protein [Balneolaceae bacterium]MBO6547955.1 hypothetical protein [Balneolaceae bacterium]MBO6648468.1 hypothetical protein [Balneolaceae bacterium]